MCGQLHCIDVQLRGNEIVPGELCLSVQSPEDPELVKVTLRFSGKEITSSDQDYFSAMCAIRRVLEQDGALLRCYGASRNVYPSGMSRSMGGGVKAYKLSMGSQAKLADLVSIFDTGPDITPATVAEQEHFFQDWLKSLG